MALLVSDATKSPKEITYYVVGHQGLAIMMKDILHCWAEGKVYTFEMGKEEGVTTKLIFSMHLPGFLMCPDEFAFEYGIPLNKDGIQISKNVQN